MKQILSLAGDLFKEIATEKIRQEKNKFLKLYFIHIAVTIAIVFLTVELTKLNSEPVTGSFFALIAGRSEFIFALVSLLALMLSFYALFKKNSLTIEKESSLKDIESLVTLAYEIYREHKDNSLKESIEHNNQLVAELKILKDEIKSAKRVVKES